MAYSLTKSDTDVNFNVLPVDGNPSHFSYAGAFLTPWVCIKIAQTTVLAKFGYTCQNLVLNRRSIYELFKRSGLLTTQLS